MTCGALRQQRWTTGTSVAVLAYIGTPMRIASGTDHQAD
jgi:hypothetical protein